MDALGVSRTDGLRQGWGASFARRSLQGFPGPSRRSKREFRGRRRDRYPSARRSGEVFLETRKILGINALVCLVAVGFTVSSADAQTATGGFMDSATSAGLRAQFSAGEIQTFLPDRGTFTFPSPYFTQGVRVTNASDCGGTDCVRPVGYSYRQQHQQPCRQRHDVDLSGSRVPARRRRTHALQLQQAHGSGPQRGPAFSRRQT